MSTPHHPARLRAYHNPENVDESKVPAGWRFRYADEAGTIAPGICHPWIPWLGEFLNIRGKHFFGTDSRITYIVPVH